MTITSKIPIILSLLSECFFQFLTLIKPGLSLKITDHITLLTETVYRSLVILLLEDIGIWLTVTFPNTIPMTILISEST